MLLHGLADLQPLERRAVIINVGTKTVTTLALFSALRYARMRVLVVDCESKDDSLEHFTDLMQRHDFDLVSLPLKPHGRTLDRLFRELPDQKILLVDSDAEILGPGIIDLLESTLGDPSTFGAGFVHGPEWMSTPRFSSADRIGLYYERMWIPFTMLDVARVREALDAGLSFIDRRIFNDVAASPLLSKLLYARFKLGRRASFRLDFLKSLRGTYHDSKPNYVFCDTGADIYQYLKYQRGYRFVGGHPDESLVAHYHGITRRLLDDRDLDSTVLVDVIDLVKSRLKDAYGYGEPQPAAH